MTASSSSSSTRPSLPFPPLTENSNSNLHSTLSLLSSLLSSSSSLVSSLSSLLSSSSSLLRCPHNPRHRLTPSSLFHHSLFCPSATPASISRDILSSLNYPQTLLQSHHHQQTQFPPNSDLLLSFNPSEISNPSSFFYRDCPGVVSFPERDESECTFLLPDFLASECANFNSAAISDHSEVNILPSDFWVLKNEVAAWVEFPSTYSYRALLSATCLNRLDMREIKNWIVTNSLKYGVVIDIPMAEHTNLLLKLCLKVVNKEAVSSLDLVMNKDSVLDPNMSSFECPLMVGCFIWLASQLAILYGQTNGRLFSVEMLKESLIHAGWRTMLFKSTEENMGIAVVRDDSDNDVGKGTQVYASQVAAAISALYERISLEERTKVLRFGHQISKSQRLHEHSYISMKASEERKKRPNYRAIIEHDGLLWHQEDQQDLGKVKTREELLAEERDYKRRRTSYRGKKVKRNPTQVLHDIIEEHMEAIKRAGATGSNLKVSGDGAISSVDWSHPSDITVDFLKPESSDYDLYEARHDLHIDRRKRHGEYNNKSYSDDSLANRTSNKRCFQNCYRSGRSGVSEHPQNVKSSKYERLLLRSQNPQYIGRNSERDMFQSKQGSASTSKDKYERHYSGNSSISTGRYGSSGSISRSSWDLDSRSENRSRRTSGSHRSESATRDSFEDRYNPYH